MESGDPFVRRVEAKRFTKDSLMRHDLHSPIPQEVKKHFISLAYFEPKPEYAVKGKFEPLDSPVSVLIPFSSGDDEMFYKMGHIKFRLSGKPCRLTAFQTEYQRKDVSLSDILFVPFFDSTNGNETFEGGRYLYVNYNDTDSVEVDFNFAANPDCAYNPVRSCPMPPEENRIPFRVEAGEKKW